LAQLPHLTELKLGVAASELPDMERIFETISSCAQLHSLVLVDSAAENGLHFTSELLSTYLPRMSQLRTLRLEGATSLVSLAFLKEGSLPKSLTALELKAFTRRLPVAEVKHVLQLRDLRSLWMVNAFDAPLGPPGELLFRRPMRPVYMPHLEDFYHRFEAPQ